MITEMKGKNNLETRFWLY